MATYKVTLTVTTQHPDPESVIEHGLKSSQDLAWWHGHKWVVRDHTIEEQEDN